MIGAVQSSIRRIGDGSGSAKIARRGVLPASTFEFPIKENPRFSDKRGVIRVKSEALQPGMVVARDVKNIDGMLLAPSGCQLSERQINILQAWGVTDLEIEAGEETAKAHDPLAQLSPETLARITAELRARFWKPDDFGPVPAEIFKLMLLRQARRILHQ